MRANSIGTLAGYLQLDAPGWARQRMRNVGRKLSRSIPRQLQEQIRDAFGRWGKFARATGVIVE
jgi:hypothetical protein